MSGKTSFRLQPTERAALDAAQAKFTTWRSYWHEDGAAFDPGALADLRKAARAFHKHVQMMLARDPIDGTRARLLARLQERQPAADHHAALQGAMFAALAVDHACAQPRGVKTDPVARAWICFAADEWRAATGKPANTGRFADALLNHRHRAVPLIGGRAQIGAALAARVHSGNCAPQ